MLYEPADNFRFFVFSLRLNLTDRPGPKRIIILKDRTIKLHCKMLCSELLCISVITLCVCSGATSQPSQHLIPPPSTYHRIQPPAFRPVSSEPPGFMTRVARWFGLGDTPNEQQLQASYFQPQYKEAPYNNYQYNRKKAPCNPCNNAPWLPMFPRNLQYPVLTSDPPYPQAKYNHQPNNNFDGPLQHISLPTYNPQQLSPAKQYAPAVNFPPYQALLDSNFRHSGGYLPSSNLLPITHHQQPIGPIPIPNLSVSPIPPLYDAVPFNDFTRNNQLFDIIEPAQRLSIQREAIPTQIPPSPSFNGESNSEIEIIKSVPLTEFLSSIEYPADVVQSSVIDLSQDNRPPQVPPFYTPEPLQVNSQQLVEVSSRPPPDNNYQQPPPSHPPITHSLEDVPRLTELGSYNPSLAPPHSEFISDPIIVQQQLLEPDSYPAASSHNISYRHENSLDVGNFVSPLQEAYDSTTEFSSNTVTGTFQTEPDISTTAATIIPFQPNLNKKSRETPKDLLDSPIYYDHGSSPRPLTRDPSDLRVRSSPFDHPNSLWQSSSTATPWALVPTPTSTYSALDASGFYAGISPPALFQSTPQPFEYRHQHQPKHIQQIVIPYTTNNRPMPFRPREEQIDKSTDNGRYVQWAHLNGIDLHEQQESKVVAATETPGTKTTKYLTKILASNIRDLLKREHEIKNKSKSPFDIIKLQKNIDDWTEQEFTSSSNKGFTVSVRGRSKNIPNEYLTTTPLLVQQSTGRLSTAFPTTTTSFVTLLGDDELKKYDFLTKLVEDNHIEPVGSTAAHQFLPSSTTERSAVSPFYIRPVLPMSSSNDLWNRLNVSISPLTKEKVHVVTPQPQFHHTTTTQDSVGSFKSPRFLIRPTPGVNTLHNSTNTQKYTPELFGLMGISSYSPPTPVETLDGHSKVITVVTPSATNKKRSAETENTSIVQSTTTDRTTS